MYILGIDPGEKGGFAFKDTSNSEMTVFEFSKMTHKEIADTLKFYACFDDVYCIIEKVHAAPGQGVVSMFTFGKNYGFWLGVLTAAGIPFEEVTPQTWQAGMGIRHARHTAYTERKRALKQKAEQLFPQLKVTLANADALLICEFASRINRKEV